MQSMQVASQMGLWVIVLLVILALLFDFMNEIGRASCRERV